MEGIKSCPRCEGDIFVNWDYTDGEWYEYCLQCSYRHYLPVVVKPRQSNGTETKRKKHKRKRIKKHGGGIRKSTVLDNQKC